MPETSPETTPSPFTPQQEARLRALIRDAIHPPAPPPFGVNFTWSLEAAKALHAGQNPPDEAAFAMASEIQNMLAEALEAARKALETRMAGVVSKIEIVWNPAPRSAALDPYLCRRSLDDLLQDLSKTGVL